MSAVRLPPGRVPALRAQSRPSPRRADRADPQVPVQRRSAVGRADRPRRARNPAGVLMQRKDSDALSRHAGEWVRSVRSPKEESP